MSTEPRDMLILCLKTPAHGGYALWWRPNQCGYCAELEGAGRYTESEAERICRGLEDHSMPIPEAEAQALACTVVDLGRLRHEPGIGVYRNKEHTDADV